MSEEKPEEFISTPEFDTEFRSTFAKLLSWRRDVRHFRTDVVDPVLIERLLRNAMLAPSVGFSQPWRWVLVESAEARSAIIANHNSANEAAGRVYEGERSTRYTSLKLAGLKEAPVHLAVFADCTAGTGHGLGRQTMADTPLWSVVMAIYALWLTAASEGLGVGWVSILDPEAVKKTLAVPEAWTFVAYLCIGWPEAYLEKPLLESSGWEARIKLEEILRRL